MLRSWTIALGTFAWWGLTIAANAQLGPETTKMVKGACPKNSAKGQAFEHPTLRALLISQGVSPAKMDEAQARINSFCERCMVSELTSRLGPGGLANLEKALNPATEKEVDKTTVDKVVNEYGATGQFCLRALQRQIELETKALVPRR